MNERKNMKLCINGEAIGFTEASKKFGIGESTIRARIRKLGWTPDEAVGLVLRNKMDRKQVIFRGITYETQEDFISAVESSSKFSANTLKVKLGKLNNLKKNILTEADLESLIHGRSELLKEGGWLYRVICLSNQKVYIGITVRPPSERWRAHVSEAYFSSSNSPLKSAIRAFGESNFKLESLEYFSNNKRLKDAERNEIAASGSLHPVGLNGNRGGTLGAIDVVPIQYQGKHFRGFRELADFYGIKPVTLRQRINAYNMSLDEAIKYEKSLQVEHEGKTYKTKKSLCLTLRIPYLRFVGLIHQGLTIDQAITRITAFIKCALCSSEFLPKNSLNKYCSVGCKRDGMYERRRAAESSNPNRRVVMYQGDKYESVTSLAKKLGLSRSQLSKALQKHASVEEAVNNCRKHQQLDRVIGDGALAV